MLQVEELEAHIEQTQQEFSEELAQAQEHSRHLSDTEVKRIVSDYQSQLDAKTRSEQQALALKRELDAELDRMRQLEQVRFLPEFLWLIP